MARVTCVYPIDSARKPSERRQFLFSAANRRGRKEQITGSWFLQLYHRWKCPKFGVRRQITRSNALERACIKAWIASYRNPLYPLDSKNSNLDEKRNRKTVGFPDRSISVVDGRSASCGKPFPVRSVPGVKQAKWSLVEIGCCVGELVHDRLRHIRSQATSSMCKDVIITGYNDIELGYILYGGLSRIENSRKWIIRTVVVRHLSLSSLPPPASSARRRHRPATISISRTDFNMKQKKDVYYSIIAKFIPDTCDYSVIYFSLVTSFVLLY